MARHLHSCFAALSVFLSCAGAMASETAPIYTMEFSRQAGEPSRWLRSAGFELKLDAEKLATGFDERGLVLESDAPRAGIFIKSLDLPRAKRVRVTWGVDRLPIGADWEAGKRRAPIAIMVWHGDEKLDSGGLFVPDSPYFTALFLGADGQEGKAYTGKYYTKGGRYFCQPCDAPAGRIIVTEFDLEDAFKRSFGKDEMPPVSAFGFQVNTRGTQGGSRAFLKSVEFLTGS